MSVFNSYIRRADDAAKAIFSEFQAAEAAFYAANTAKENGPRPARGGFQDHQTAAKIARLDADFNEAKAALDAARRTLPERGEKEILAIRAELVDALNRTFTVNPSDIDANVLELLKSGICSAIDYEKLMSDADKAQNATMIRLIASYASRAAETMLDEDVGVPFDCQEEYARIYEVGRQGSANTSKDKLQAYDVLTEAFQRTMQNTAMIGDWGMLTEPLIERF